MQEDENRKHIDVSRHFPSDTYAGMYAFYPFKEYGDAPIVRRSEVLWEELRDLFRKINFLKREGIIDGLHYEKYFFNDEPKFKLFSISGTPKFYVKNEPAGTGKSWKNEKRALEKCVGEVVERISLYNFLPSHAKYAAASELGESAIDFDSIVGADKEFREEVEKSEVFQKNHSRQTVCFDEMTPFHWVQATQLGSGQKKYIPLQLMTLSRSGKLKEEPIIRFPLSTGAAAGATLNDALLGGILEIIERDAFMITWLNQLSLEQVDIDSVSSKNLKELFDTLKRYQLELHLLLLPTDVGLPGFLSVIIDRTGIGPAIVFETRIGFDVEELIEEVVIDTLLMRMIVRKSNSQRLGNDFSHITLRNRAAFWYPTEKIPYIKQMLVGEKKSVEYFKQKFVNCSSLRNAEEQLSYVQTELERLNLTAYWVETTMEQLRPLGIPAVAVFIPGMQPLYVDECFPYTKGNRFTSVPHKLGLEIHKKPSQPHPFA